jgi:hypothetical protein
MKKALLTACVALLGASPAYAVPFTLSSYTVNYFNETPGDQGLDIDVTKVMPEPQGFNLAAVGSSFETDLFRIGTTEDAAAQADDVVQKSISVDFTFASPSFTGTESGVTGGSIVFPGNGAATIVCFFLDGCGYVTWGAPAVLSFGTTGLLQIALTDAIFGSPGDAIVKARFTLLQEDAAAPVPEPGTLALFGSGLALAASRLRKRRK